MCQSNRHKMNTKYIYIYTNVPMWFKTRVVNLKYEVVQYNLTKLLVNLRTSSFFFK